MATQLPPPTLLQVQEFLRQLHTFMGQKSPFILVKDRDKNRQGLIDLKLDKDPSKRMKYLAALQPEHACHVLESDYENEALQKQHLWVFGILVGKKKRPAYVKIQLGRTITTAICISFHPPEYQLSFLFSSDHSTAFQQAYDAQSYYRPPNDSH